MRALAIAAVFVLAAETDVAAQRLTPHIVGWERHFTVNWETVDRRGQPHLTGSVVSRYGSPTSRIRLLIDSLDASGQIVAQRIEWLGGDVGPFSRRYFEVTAPRSASSYRVSVFAFDILQTAHLEAP